LESEKLKLFHALQKKHIFLNSVTLVPPWNLELVQDFGGVLQVFDFGEMPEFFLYVWDIRWSLL